jgi:NAD(P)-dependent dehydrogenase (short-subunit alcohol dehydrogenase family)
MTSHDGCEFLLTPRTGEWRLPRHARAGIVPAIHSVRGDDMDLKLAGKTALITGASKGIGRASAETLAREGCNVILVSRTQSDLEAAKAGIARTANVRVDVVAADLSDGRNVDRLAGEFPRVDILVNNAGAIPGGTLADIDEARWRAAWDLKVFGYINMCRRYYPLMKERKAGTIINIVGNAAQTHDPEYICGVAGNSALCAFSQSLGSVSARDGIRVIAISPGPVSTERLVNLMRKKAQDRTGDAENWRDLLKPLPFGRASTPEEIGAAVAFHASEHSGYMSGAVVVIDAGLSARSFNF